MSSDPIKFAYVCLCHNPWGVVSGPLYAVDCDVTMLMYRGSFEPADLANKLVPLARQEMVAFPQGTLDAPGLAWQGTATRCSSNCFMFQCAFCFRSQYCCMFCE